MHSFLSWENARWELYQQWVDDADSDNFTTSIFQECPADIIDEYCEVYTEVKSYSTSRLVYGTYQLDPELRRKNEKQYGSDAGYDWLTIIVQDRDGKIVGLTEMYTELDGTVAYQELTGVLPAYRGKGLAKWIKALMILRLRERYPDIETIRVTNWRGAKESSKAIIGLNDWMGFNELFSTFHYRLKV